LTVDRVAVEWIIDVAQGDSIAYLKDGLVAVDERPDVGRT
jgi:hypothetical protein